MRSVLNAEAGSAKPTQMVNVFTRVVHSDVVALIQSKE